MDMQSHGGTRAANLDREMGKKPIAAQVYPLISAVVDGLRWCPLWAQYWTPCTEGITFIKLGEPVDNAHLSIKAFVLDRDAGMSTGLRAGRRPRWAQRGAGYQITGSRRPYAGIRSAAAGGLAAGRASRGTSQNEFHVRPAPPS
jgi:hypothetical protein